MISFQLTHCLKNRDIYGEISVNLCIHFLSESQISLWQHQKRRRCEILVENKDPQQQKAHPERINKEKRLYAPQNKGK